MVRDVPAGVVKQGDLYRVVEDDGSLVNNAGGTPVDGGGHVSREGALAQARAINAGKAMDSFVTDASAELATDRGELGQFREIAGGAIVVPAKLARIGVQTYPHGGEYRDPSEVFSQDSQASLESAPTVWLHPEDARGQQIPVTAENVRTLSLGHVRNVHVDGEWLCADLVIADAGLQQKIRSREAREISCGYVRQITRDSGVYRGASYEYSTSEIRYNHVAVGPADWARAGSEAKLLVDSKDAYMNISTITLNHDEAGKVTGASYDGQTYGFGELAKLRAAVRPIPSAGLATDQVDPAAMAVIDQIRATHEAQTANLMALLDALAVADVEVATLTEAAASPESAALAVADGDRDKARARAQKLAPKLVTDGLTIPKIRRAVVEELGHDVESESDEYVRALFEKVPRRGTFGGDAGDVVGSGTGARAVDAGDGDNKPKRTSAQISRDALVEAAKKNQRPSA